MAEQKKVKRIHIINKFGPEDNAITGRSAGELGTELMQAGHQVDFFCIKDSYKAIGAVKKPTSGYHITSLRKISLGAAGKRRLATALLDGLRLTFQSLLKRADVVIVMTDPPLINIWYRLFKVFSRRKVLYWTMDLYPDAFASSGIVSSNSFLYKFLSNRIYSQTPDGIIALGQQQLGYLQKKYKKAIPAVLLPCGIESVTKDEVPPEWITTEDEKKMKFCYAGNIGEAHDESFLVSFIKALNPQKHVMYINLYGSKADKILSEIGYLPAVRRINYLPYSQMHFIDIHLASLLCKWDHVCVPSKAVSAICAGAVLVLNTSSRCDNWVMLQKACWLIEQNDNDYDKTIDLFLGNLTCKAIYEKKDQAASISIELVQRKQLAYNQILNWIENENVVSSDS